MNLIIFSETIADDEFSLSETSYEFIFIVILLLYTNTMIRGAGLVFTFLLILMKKSRQINLLINLTIITQGLAIK